METNKKINENIHLNKIIGFNSVTVLNNDFAKAIINKTELWIREPRLYSKTNNKELWIGIANHTFKSNILNINEDTQLLFEIEK